MRKKVAIIGGGTSALFLAAFLDTDKYELTIFEKKSSFGRKFLVAGDGGFNLTHAEPLPIFKSRYTPLSLLNNALEAFHNEDLRAWLLKIGIPTFVGSSNRVFPEKGIKPIEVLKTIENNLVEKGVHFEYNKTFTHWTSDGEAILNTNEVITSSYTIFALGGSSWKVTGSDGSWLSAFQEKGIATLPFQASNCAFKIDWSEQFIQKYGGEPLKNITISTEQKTQKGEAVITKYGLEGNAIYGLSPEIQKQLQAKEKAIVYVDFKPTMNVDRLIEKLKSSNSNTTSTLKEKIKLPKVVIELLKNALNKTDFLDDEKLSHHIKNFPLSISDAAPIDEAISTAGGISLVAVDSNFELKNMPGQFCIGEMLDWDAPTGGYLIQACASMGVYLAQHLNRQ